MRTDTREKRRRGKSLGLPEFLRKPVPTEVAKTSNTSTITAQPRANNISKELCKYKW